jgi:hypothetical protein
VDLGGYRRGSQLARTPGDVEVLAERAEA